MTASPSPTTSQDPGNPPRRKGRVSFWWIVSIVLVILPVILVLVFLWSTPDVATFDYSPF
jgi:hypothetical protein